MKILHGLSTLLSVFVVAICITTSLPMDAIAAVANWQQGITIVPESSSQLGGDEFKESARNLKNTGADYLSIVVPYSQANVYSTDIRPTWNTPSDESLISAIDYAHSIGLNVMLNFHVEVDTGDWRAHINPSDRNAWFQSYGNFLRKYAQIAQEHDVEQLLLGAELISMTNKNVNGTNTQNWNALIDSIRGIYTKGTLTYSANRGGDWFYDEKNNIEFWDKLDYLGLSPYFELNKDPNRPVESLKEQWESLRWNEIEPFRNRFNKDIIFTEIGYRSADNAAKAPYDYWSNTNVNEQEQADAYQALLSYWNDVSYIKGIHMWNWKADPNAGGSGNSEYTPQHKKAEVILKDWFSGSGPVVEPPTPQTASFSQVTTVTPGVLTIGNEVQIKADIKNAKSTAAQGLLIDLEVYNGAKQKVHQQVFDNESITGNQSKTFTTNWKPNDNGVYTVQLGVFSSDWSTNYFWESNAAQFTVTTGTTTPPTNPENPTTPQAGILNVWWPSNGSSVSGTQPFKAMLENNSVENYKMFWQVDGDRLNEMYNSNEDYPHKEAWVDVSGWNWKESSIYNLNFVAQDFAGKTITTKAVEIRVTQ